ncbi:hypothetical protein ALC57_02851 [Trachymyrmex cornetzi]|uniref:Reverse transcriptase domain-containing protein n=1 Tax=Trachymyrmex cornetzi TaxID=471704 RepID=A0A195EIR2_9HYME|nr:hypothetical protein ALC57_02851 [Trachymyrmex cornetzi]
MRSMIQRLEGYVDRKGLKLNKEKTKIMRFRKGRGRSNKVDWRWKRNGIEEVGKFKYLGYTYGVEIWGWKERQRVERVQERYIRWVLVRTPEYMIREEIQRVKLRDRAGKRAWALSKYDCSLQEGSALRVAAQK